MVFCLDAFYLEALSVCQLTHIHRTQDGDQSSSNFGSHIFSGAFRGSQEYGLIHVEAQQKIESTVLWKYVEVIESIGMQIKMNFRGFQNGKSLFFF